MRDALFNFGEEIFPGVGAFEIQPHLALADSEDVAMRIGQPRHDRVAVKIDNLRGVKFLRLLIRADENDAVAFHRDRLSFRLLVLDGVDVSVRENKIDILGANHWAKKEKSEKKRNLTRVR